MNDRSLNIKLLQTDAAPMVDSDDDSDSSVERILSGGEKSSETADRVASTFMQRISL
jgi:hypothetical protein